jgi:hypothetical protein
MDNVINLDDRRKKKQLTEDQLSFEEVSAINQDNRKKTEAERREHNRLVLIKYKIKPAQ